MSNNSAQADSVTMSGGGIYSLATKGAKDVIDAATPLVVEAIRNVQLEAFHNGFTFSDMGIPIGMYTFLLPCDEPVQVPPVPEPELCQVWEGPEEQLVALLAEGREAEGRRVHRRRRRGEALAAQRR